MKGARMDYQTDEGAWAIGCVILTLLAVLCIYAASPARSQEDPQQPPCTASADMEKTLQAQYGETVTAAGVVNNQYMELYTNAKTHTFTIVVRRTDGNSCMVMAGEGFALADPARMKGKGT
jgi:hypothetical protein